ncbi:MAG TPA: helix-turn-helix domain-containing protein [Planctomycetota bacterium]|nr:helix-turn-helix domain-containing protein [Planctomycetota bacterium]
MKGDARIEVPALERALAILNYISEQRSHAASVPELAAALKIPTSSAYRIVDVLLDKRLVTEDPGSGLLMLGPGCMALGYVARNFSPVARAAQPVLRDLARDTHHMAEIAVRVGPWRLMRLEQWRTENTPVSFRGREGQLIPLNHDNAHGLCFLSFSPARVIGEFRAAAADTRFQKFLMRYTPIPDDLAERCARFREQGYARSNEPNPETNVRVAVPLFDPHSSRSLVAATLAVACHADELSDAKAARWAKALHLRAKALAQIFVEQGIRLI